MTVRLYVGDEMRSGDKADKLDAAIISALEANPTLIYKRFQITSACNINWISRMIYMKRRFGNRFLIFINRDYDHLGCFCAIDPAKKGCIYEWQLLSGRYYLRGTVSKGYGFTYKNKKICAIAATIFGEIERARKTNYLEEDHKRGEMTVDRLRKFQKELWDERVRRIQIDPEYEIGDEEISEAFEKRGLNMRSFELSMMDFRFSDFPEIAYPLPPATSLSQSIARKVP